MFFFIFIKNLIICVGIGVVCAAFVFAFGVLCFGFAFFPSIIIPAVTIPERKFDDKFHDAECEFVGVISVAGETETEYYPEFHLYRKGVSKGIGVPFKRCKSGKHCERNHDGHQVCEWKLKHVNCENFKNPTGQTDGKVSWNNGEFHIGQRYDCEITNSDLEKVSSELGCSTWPNDMGCAMMHRSNKPPNAVDDETFWGLLWGFIFVPLILGATSIVAAVPVFGFFLMCAGFIWLLLYSLVLCKKGTEATINKVEKYRDGNEKAQTEKSLPYQGESDDDSDEEKIEYVDLEDQI